MRILVVEDEEAIADALVHMLIKNKYLADACYDGESGLDNALTDIYDLIILDIMLPKMNGLDVLKNLRNNNISCPVILLTAKDEISDKVLIMVRMIISPNRFLLMNLWLAYVVCKDVRTNPLIKIYLVFRIFHLIFRPMN